MAQAATNKEYNTFVKGLITEASPLTFPENASLEENNFNLLRDGSRRRRLGVDYEQGYHLVDTGLTEEVFNTVSVQSAVWNNVSNDPLVSLLVVQVGTRFWFFDAFAEDLSAAPKNGGNPIDLAGVSSDDFQGASIFGKLVIVNGQQGFFVLTYDKITDTVTINSRLLLVRDIWGVEDGLTVNQRPAALSAAHEYNLLNQGWGGDNRDSVHSFYGKFFRDLYKYPSNSDIVWVGKNPNDRDEFTPNLIARYFPGSTPAAKGSHIIDVFKRGSSRLAAFNRQAFTHTSSDISGDPFSLDKFLFDVVEGKPTVDADGEVISLTSTPFYQPLVNISPTLPSDFTDGGLKTITAFAGRLFFSGSTSTLVDGDRRSPNLGGYVFFSQVVDTDRKMGLCHQEGDAGSEDTPDVLDSDGGSVLIPEASGITKLIAISNGVLVFAENGVWEITGGDTPFSATNFSVRNVTNSGALSPDSVVQVESTVLFWSRAGIIALSPDQVTGYMSAQNLTETTIQTFYNDIPNGNKAHARGQYDSASRKVMWLYSTETPLGGEVVKNKYNSLLSFDLVLSAFHTETYGEVSENPPYIAGFIETPNYSTLDVETTVVSGGENVVDRFDFDVIVQDTVRSNGVSKSEFLAIKPGSTYGFTVALKRDDKFIDWKSDDGVGIDAAAHMLTGYEILEDTQRNKQAPYITCNFRRTETGFEEINGSLVATNPSSCLVQSQWDYADSAASNKFSKEFQAYRLKRQYITSGLADPFDYGHTVITSKSKLRGRGKALSLLFKSEPEKDLHLYGWGLSLTGSTNV